ncbi:MAG: FxsB family radical SAM/SPASM domain protein [Proteobacteria bacterium]|nr:FxsB family radical SAM/SPASM domain protein [Pseudomonadota bacterium]
MAAARITSFLVKIASRCNLDCDYCYVYHHADQSWRRMPKTLSDEHRTAFAERLAEYARHHDLKECFVVLHGGEPLLAGAEAIATFVQRIRHAVGESTKVEFGVQTNGLLLTDAALDILEKAGVVVSLSLDGPREVNDLHRTTKKRRSSFDKVEAALERLQKRPNTFAGVIAVIDPRAAPDTLFSYFDQYQIPRLDFLLPDAHHLRPPPGRAEQPALYRDWLIRAFDLWLDQYPHLPVRFFETLLDAAAGLPSQTDAIGFGDISLLSIETDGSYHDLDVLKVVGEGVSALAGSVSDRAISDVAASPAIDAHRRLLTKDGLCETCRSCRVVEICGGGSVPHRHGPDGFNHPSVYCEELFSLIEHVTARLKETLVQSAPPASRLPPDFDFARFESAESALAQVDALRDDAEAAYVREFRSALELAKLRPGADTKVSVLLSLAPEEFRRAASWPGAVAWSGAYLAQAAGKTVLDVDGRAIPIDVDYLNEMVAARVWLRDLETPQPGDVWLRYPFGEAIFFEAAGFAAKAAPLVSEALQIIEQWRPKLAAEIRRTSKAVLFIRDLTAHPEKIVSFSDNSVPGALFVSVWQGDRLIDPYDLADSLIHEHRHQKLYLLERFAPMVRSSTDLVVSPWREDLRPPSGLLHAIFVFVELRRFWRHVRDGGPERLRQRAIDQLEDTDRNLNQAFATLATCPLSEAGQCLANVLDRVRLDALASAA